RLFLAPFNALSKFWAQKYTATNAVLVKKYIKKHPTNFYLVGAFYSKITFPVSGSIILKSPFFVVNLSSREYSLLTFSRSTPLSFNLAIVSALMRSKSLSISLAIINHLHSYNGHSSLFDNLSYSERSTAFY